MKKSDRGERNRSNVGCTIAGSRRSKVTLRSSAATSVAACADTGADAPIDAASGGLLVDGARFLPAASDFSSPTTTSEAMVRATVAQPSTNLRPGDERVGINKRSTAKSRHLKAAPQVAHIWQSSIQFSQETPGLMRWRQKFRHKRPDSRAALLQSSLPRPQNRIFGRLC